MDDVRFLLEEDGKPINFYSSFDEAKDEGNSRVGNGLPLLITSFSAPAPSRGWRYDRDVSNWVETPLP
ncbi:hypothetical protein [uncultured Nisaea sp.]|jgi:hypothetical protein|uniref:hypothetical protein n=1 Tax=uncultured Nisaea sp. TaxID=538215 RepID=UPI0030EF4F7C|tara:strand:- start:261 stop:464 length:204 start_codon:yes stop_codon:yes gene_type:complete